MTSTCEMKVVRGEWRCTSSVARQIVVGLVWLAVLGSRLTVCGQAITADSLLWTSAPSIAFVGVPVGASLQALDANGNAATSFNGTVRLTALARGMSPGLLISEVAALSTRVVELCNVSDAPVAVSGWHIDFYDASTWPAPRATFIVPPGTVCAPRSVFQVTAGGNAPGIYPGFFLGTNLVWSSNLPDNPIAVLLRDPAGKLVDFFCACGGYPFLINSPTPLPSDLWQGLPLPAIPFSSRTYQRLGGLDHNNSADWLATNSTLGVLNGGLRFPFSAPLQAFSVSPSTVQFSQGQWQGSPILSQSGHGIWLHADDGAGLAGDSGIFDVAAGPPLALELPPGGSEATPGMLGQGRVFIQQTLPTNLTVTLSMDLAGEISLPATVILGAGQTNAIFAVTNLDDALLDGTRTVTVTAFAPGFASASGVVTNADNEVGVLTVTLPASAREGDGVLTAAGLVMVSLPVGIDYPVMLSSSKTNKVQVPASVYIPAGQTSAVFSVTIINDAVLDGPQLVTVQASASGAAGSSAQITVADNENPTLHLDLVNPVEEGTGVVSNAVRVTLGGVAVSNVMVSLVSLDPARLQVPSTMVVPAGQISAQTFFSVPDDGFTNGTEVVQVNASAPGFSDASNATNVRDNDVHHFSIVALPNAQASGEPFVMTIFADTIDGYTPSTYAGQAMLRAVGHAGPVSVSPSNLTFTAGGWSGNIIVTGESRETILTVDDGLGHSGASNPFDVSLVSTSGPPVSDLVYDPSRGQIVAGVLATGGSNSNSVVGIDPVTGGILWAVPLGTEPSRLVLSDDYTFLYVGGNTTGGLARVNLSTRTVALRFPLGSDPSFGPYLVEDMEVMPGNPRTVVVSRKVAFGGYGQGLAVYDDRVQRPDTIGPGSYASGYHLGFYGHSNKLYEASADGLTSLAVTTNGLTAIDSHGGSVYATDFEFDGGFLYGSSGTVFWPETAKIAGAFPAYGWVRPDAASGRIAFLNGNSLRIFDQNSYVELGALNLVSGNTASLIRCGADRLAFRADNRLTILRTDLLTVPASTDLLVTQNTLAVTPIVGSNFTYLVVISNAGPASAANVVLADQFPESAAFVSATPSQGACGQTNGMVSCQLGLLPNGASASVAVTVRARTPGEMVNAARAIGGALNPVLPALTEISLDAAALVYDSASNRLWASVFQNAGQIENSLWSIPLATGLREPPISVGGGPGIIRISDDSQYIYVAVDPLANVYRFSTRTRTKNLQFSADGTVVDLAVVPGDPASVAISRESAQDDVGLFRNGLETKRSPVDIRCRHLAYSDSSNRLYAANIDSLFIRLDVTSTNLLMLDATPGLAVGLPDIRFANNRVFTTAGIVIDPLALRRIADLPANGFVQPDLAVGQIFYLGQDPNSSVWVLTSFDSTTLLPSWAVALPEVSGVVRSMVGCTPGVLAFNTSERQMFVLNTALLPHAASADLETWFVPPTSYGATDARFTVTGIVRNNGPAPAINLILTNTFSDGTVLLAQSASQGSCTNIGGMLVCQFNNVNVGEAASVTLTAMKTNAGTLLVTATASSDVSDSVPNNNTGTFTAQITQPPSADVMVWQSSTVGGGGQFAYSLVVSNAGPDTATGITLTDYYPDAALVLSAGSSQGSLTTNNGTVTANLGSLAPGAAAFVSLMVQPPNSATIGNLAVISSTTPDPFLPNNQTISVSTLSGVSLVKEIVLLAADFAYDAVHRRLYASVAPEGGFLSNSIVSIDPDTGAYTQQNHFTEPIGKLAVTDDGQYLYAALTQTGGVLRISTATGLVEERILLPTDTYHFNGIRVALDLAPIPGQPKSIAVTSRWLALHYDPGIEIYDGATIRSNKVLIRYGASHFYAAFPNSSDRLYASGYGGFHVLQVDSTGVSYNGPTLDTFLDSDFVLDGGLAYFDSGEVLDPETPTILATFPFTTGFVAPDIASNRVYFLPSVGNGVMSVRAFDPLTLSELWSLQFSTPPAVERGFLKLRSGEFAVRTDGSGGRILIVRPSPLDLPVADLALTATASPNPVNVGGTITYSITLRNNGPWTATNVVVSDTLPVGTSFAGASGGSCTESNGIILCSIDPMANGASTTLTIGIVPNTPGLLSNQVVVANNFTDPNPANNSTSVTAMVNPSPSLSISDAIVLEGSNRTPITFNLTLSALSTVPVSVNYATSDGTAIASQDYDATNGVVTFAPGIKSRIITLAPGIRGNTTVESNRFFFINLSIPTNAILVRNQATGLIVEDDFNSVSVQNVSVVEGNSGRTNALFRFLLAPASSNTVTVDYATIDGTATAGSDYLARQGTLIFPPGTTNQTLNIPVLGDLCNEPDEIFLLQISAPVNALLLLNEATGRILNDDPAPLLQILSFAPVGNGWRTQFSSACGRFYRLRRSETLTPSSWVTVADQIAGTGDTVSVTDRTAPPASQSFYRIELLP